MENYKAIPLGYMTVGEVAKKMGITVRTLQYYDKVGLLFPSTRSEGGRRLYTDKDLVILHQIISLKSLGFSLDKIKENLVSLESPNEVADALTKQAEVIKLELEKLNSSLAAIEQLKEEVLQMENVNFKKYADIIVNLQMNNEYYFLIKKFDDDTLDKIRRQFDKDSSKDFINRFNLLCENILQLKEENVAVDSERCQKVTKDYWDLISEFTEGDMGMLPKLFELGDFKNASSEWEKKMASISEYISPALAIYFSKLGINPFQEAK